MTELCLGTVQFGMNYGVQGNGQPSSSEAISILNAAYNAGIRAYDTASAYGTAERVLHQFLSQTFIDRDTVQIISKTKSHDLNLVTDAKTSLENLGIQYLYGYLLHDAKLVFNPVVMQNLQVIKDIGLSKEIGVSVYTPEEALQCLKYDSVDIIQVPYNVLDRRLDNCNFFEKAKSLGIDVYVRSVLLQGLLMMNPENIPPQMRFAESFVKQYQEQCCSHNVSYFEGAVGYVLQHPDIDFLVFGVDNISHLNEYIHYSQRKSDVNLIDVFQNEFQNVPERVLMPNLW